MSDDDQKNAEQKILEIVHSAIAEDEALRQKYQIGDKFRFIRDRLQSLGNELDEFVKEKNIAIEKSDRKVAANEIVVYVYLFNAHGANFRSWQNMITPKVFYEYSVNRPIYTAKKDIESLIRTKANKLQHGFLEVIVRAEDITQGEAHLKDFAGNPLIKVKEGALQIKNLISFNHNASLYILTSEGELSKKEL